jgi:hypothetical protein
MKFKMISAILAVAFFVRQHMLRKAHSHRASSDVGKRFVDEWTDQNEVLR